jgi:hypothetical protein
MAGITAGSMAKENPKARGRRENIPSLSGTNPSPVPLPIICRRFRYPAERFIAAAEIPFGIGKRADQRVERFEDRAHGGVAALGKWGIRSWNELKLLELVRRYLRAIASNRVQTSFRIENGNSPRVPPMHNGISRAAYLGETIA